MAFKLAEAFIQLSSRGLSGVGRSLGMIKTRLSSLVGPAGRIGSLMAGIGTGLTIKAMITLSSQAERLAVSFEVLLGSATAAKQVMEDINEFAAKTPFEQIELAQAAKKLLAFRVEQEALIPLMKRLGDLAAVSGAQLTNLAAIYGKIKGKGRLTMEEMNQLAERGIASMQDFQEILGLTPEQLRKQVEQGKVSFQDFEKVLNSLTDEGGKFFNGMLKLSQTLFGRWSTFTGNMKLLLAKLGTAITEAFDVKGIIVSMSDFVGSFWERFGGAITTSLDQIAASVRLLVKAFRDLPKFIGPMAKLLWQGTVGIAIGVVEALGAITDAIGVLGVAVIALTVIAAMNPILAMVTGVVLLVGLVRELGKRFAILGEIGSFIWNIFRVGVKGVSSLMSEMMGVWLDLFSMLFGIDLGGWFNSVFGDFTTFISEMNTAMRFMLENWELTWDLMKSLVQDAVDNMKDAIKSLVLGVPRSIAGQSARTAELLAEIQKRFAEQLATGGAEGAKKKRAGAIPGAAGADGGGFRFTSLAALANQMQTEAGKRNAERTATATERTADAVEEIARQQEGPQQQRVALDIASPIPAFQ